MPTKPQTRNFNIGPGDSVTILTPHGQKRTGRAVMRSGDGGWVLNMGGRHGTPGLADISNIVSVRKARTPGPRINPAMDLGQRKHSVPAASINRVAKSLQGLTEAQLMVFWKCYNRPTRQDAKTLLGSAETNYTRVTMDFANYASNLATAKQCARTGNEQGREMYQSIADGILNSLALR